MWIEPYWNAEHLVRTRDWLLELEPDASEALRLAALTHDMERHFPGGPVDGPGQRHRRRTRSTDGFTPERSARDRRRLAGAARARRRARRTTSGG